MLRPKEADRGPARPARRECARRRVGGSSHCAALGLAPPPAVISAAKYSLSLSDVAACISRELNPGHIDGNDVFYH